MRDVIVAIDLETTGLDATHDQIIEIGAVKFREGEVLDEFSSFIDPGRSIPPGITQLTGITDEDIQGAPRFSAVANDLRRFIGSAPVLGHNVQFDVGFLEANGLRVPNERIDTYTLASVLLPETPRYNLSALASMLGIDSGNAHRAIDDVHTTMALYLELWERALALPLDLLAEIVRLGRGLVWDAGAVFEAALRQRSRETVAASEPVGLIPDDDSEALDRPGKRDSLHPGNRLVPLDVHEIASLMGAEGPLAQYFENYEYRHEQIDMLTHVSQAFNEGRHLFIEAPTGVGKSLAYLVPAAHFALANDDRVVISTNTINLQEQLITKDIPLLQETLGIPVRAAVLKGRSNYLCPRRLAAMRRRGPTSAEDLHVLVKILVWRLRNRSGDRGQITLRGPVEQAVWRRLSAEDEGCTVEQCAAQKGEGCPFYLARQRAEVAHLLVVNHALLLSDIAAEGRVLPDYSYLVVDEAHHLEDAVTTSMTFRTDPESIKRQMAELGTPRTGLLGELLRRTEGVLPEVHYATLREFVETVSGASAAMSQHIDWFFTTLRSSLEDRVPHNEYFQQIRILEARRRQPAWSEVELRWDKLGRFTETIAEAMIRLAAALNDLEDYDIEDFDDLISGIGAIARRLAELHERLTELAVKPDANTVYWVQFMPDGSQISVHAAPLDVSLMVRDNIWYKKDAIVMTSATLRTDGTFDFLRRRLGAEDVEEVVIDTPFDYESSTLLYIVDDIPEPSDRDAYQKAVERGLIDLCLATEGRALVLFTSYAQLRQTTNAISGRLAQNNISVYDQTEGSSRSQLLDAFVRDEKAVLMGTRSFWEGVDVPGADLSVLIIVRLPFSVPSDPLFAARSEQYENPFAQFALPETILRFRQGFGRLIRRSTDRGIVAIFDRRIVSKPYGHLFLDSLPRCAQRTGRLVDLPVAARGWLNR